MEFHNATPVIRKIRADPGQDLGSRSYEIRNTYAFVFPFIRFDREYKPSKYYYNHVYKFDTFPPCTSVCFLKTELAHQMAWR